MCDWIFVRKCLIFVKQNTVEGNHCRQSKEENNYGKEIIQIKIYVRWKRLKDRIMMIYFTMEFGTDKLANDRANRTRVVSTEVYWNASKKNDELTTLVLTIYADRLLLVVVVILIVVVVSLSRTTVGAM